MTSYSFGSLSGPPGGENTTACERPRKEYRGWARASIWPGPVRADSMRSASDSINVAPGVSFWLAADMELAWARGRKFAGEEFVLKLSLLLGCGRPQKNDGE